MWDELDDDVQDDFEGGMSAGLTEFEGLEDDELAEGEFRSDDSDQLEDQDDFFSEFRDEGEEFSDS